MANSPLHNAKDLVTYTILSGGSQIKDTYQVFSIEVEYGLNQVPRALIRLQDGDVATKEFEAANSSDFVPGKEIEIQAGYESENTTIFKGIVVSMQMRMDTSEGSVLEVNCRDKAILMTSARKNAYFNEMMDSDIISKLIGDHGLDSDVVSTQTKHEKLVQYDTTDWDFMLLRADINGLVANVSQGNVSVKKPDVNSSPVLALTYGVDLLEFAANLNAIDQLPGVDAVAWDPSSQAVVSQSASNPSVNSQGNISGTELGGDLGVDSETLRTSAGIESGSLKSWADAKLLKSRLSSLTGHASFTGSALVLPNTTIEINGVGDRFSGTAYVTSVRHSIRDGMWVTEAGFGLDDEWYASRPNLNPMPAAGLTPEYGGLMVGKVMKLNEDPKNEIRIQVKLPMMQDDSNGIWARLSNYYATSGRGNFFIPEIGDEVVIGFMNNDPNYPVILGSLYSSNNTPPYALTEENYTKAIVTKSDCKIEFNDEKKVISIQTPGDNKIIISDEDKGITIQDQNSNMIITNEQGISIEDFNGNKIVMSGSGIQISSSTNIEIKAGADVSVSGINLTHSADATLKATGQASAELSANGETTIRGGIVMIN